MRLRYWRLVVAVLVLTVGMMGGTARAQMRDRYGSGEAIAQTAQQYVGARYAIVGDTWASGFSCVGLVHAVYAAQGVWVPENLWGLWSGYVHVAPGALQPGDVVLFENTVWYGLSHAAIYVGYGRMIGADNFSVGVRVDNLYDSYWYSRWIGTVRIVQ